MPQTAAHPWRRPAVLATVAVFLATRVYFYGYFIAGHSDVMVYFRYAVLGVDLAKLPYEGFEIEYPPVAYWTMIWPRMLSSWRLEEPLLLNKPYQTHLNHYDWGFRAEMLAFDLGGFLLFGLIFAKRRPQLLAWALAAYTAITGFLCYLLYDRLDIGLTVLMLGWAYAWLRADDGNEKSWRWVAIGYAALGIGISYKLVPVVLAPFALLADFFLLPQKWRDWRFCVGPAVFLAAALGPYAYYYWRVGPALLSMFEYHAERGVQIESSYATVMMIALPRDRLECYFDFGSWNLRGPWEPWLLVLSSALLPAALAVLGLRSLACPLWGERYDRTAAVRIGGVVIAVATVLAKVLSPQYLLWSLPMLLIATAEYLSPRAFKCTVVSAVIAAALTSFLYPCHYVDTMLVPPYHDAHPPHTEAYFPHWSLIHDHFDRTGELSRKWLPIAAIVGRNVILLALTVVVAGAALARKRKRDAAPDSS